MSFLLHNKTHYLCRSLWNTAAATFDCDAMSKLLDHDNHDMRAKFREFVSDPVMTPKYNIPLDEERDVALQRLKRICDVGIKIIVALNNLTLFFILVIYQFIFLILNFFRVDLFLFLTFATIHFEYLLPMSWLL